MEAYRDLLGLVLNRTPGFLVVGEAGDGQEAINVAAETKPDVILLDIAMPVIDGLTALPQILSVSPASQVIMLTGFASTDLKLQAIASGAFEYLEKGTSVIEILASIKRACEAP